MLERLLKSIPPGKSAAEAKMMFACALRIVVWLVCGLFGATGYILNMYAEVVNPANAAVYLSHYLFITPFFLALNGLNLHLIGKSKFSVPLQHLALSLDCAVIVWFLVYWMGSLNSALTLTFPFLVFFYRIFVSKSLSKASIFYLIGFYSLVYVLELYKVLPYAPIYKGDNPLMPYYDKIGSHPVTGAFVIAFIFSWLIITYLATDFFMKVVERSEEQLLQSESLASVGQLVATIVHDLNNPLASAKSLTDSTRELLEEIADREIEEVSEALEDLEFVGKEIARAEGLVRSLLNLSRRTDTVSEEVDVNRLVRDVAEIGRVQIKKTCGGAFDIELDLADPAPVARGNFAKYGQVLLNIVNNALQAVDPKSARIVISTSRTADGRTRIECRDNGDGMNEETLRCAFSPFFTTKLVSEGTGLGLHICEEVLKRLGGSITLESEVGKGTLAIVTLPNAKAISS